MIPKEIKKYNMHYVELLRDVYGRHTALNTRWSEVK